MFMIETIRKNNDDNESIESSCISEKIAMIQTNEKKSLRFVTAS